MSRAAVIAMSPKSLLAQLFTPQMLADLREAVDVDTDLVITSLEDEGAGGGDGAGGDVGSDAGGEGGGDAARAARTALADAELLIAGWGAPRIGVADAPNLRGVVYLGGVAATCLDDPAAWAARGLVASNARAANAVPVAEFALAMILLAGKDAPFAEQRYRDVRRMPDRAVELTDVGNYRKVVGIVGLSQIAQVLIELLRPFDLDVVVYSPSLTPDRAAELGVRMGTLAEVVSTADVVSLHQAVTPATVGQIDAALLASMRDGATLLNTARGEVVDQDALVRELRSGRIRAILDVTTPEPLPHDHPLWSTPNTVLTPHLAGSMGTELYRMGASALDEVRRFVDGRPFAHREDLA
ncbi:hydroxyacid dehydrogenase [Agromyces sp. NPDC058110]|uniref:hydroxyacid dehydrogenase n=1 Tax=Agromyces sp. NPDC058110 TaxID=3346345 RepID=UPI0036D97C9F